jgi:hypothetical protein
MDDLPPGAPFGSFGATEPFSYPRPMVKNADCEVDPFCYAVKISDMDARYSLDPPKILVVEDRTTSFFLSKKSPLFFR